MPKTSEARCRVCVLPSSFPHVRFEDGVCSLCRERAAAPDERRLAAEARRRFEARLAAEKGKYPYDVLLCYSGGKDSTYTLWLLRERYRARVLAFTFDNGFMPAEAVENVAGMTSRLGADSLTLKPPAALLNRVFAGSYASNPYSPKTPERSSVACASCIGIIKYAALKTALEKDVPFIAYGWTPGQAPLSAAVLELEAGMVNRMAAAVRAPLEALAGEPLGAYFPEERAVREARRLPALVHPAAFSGYDETRIFRTISGLGWKRPKGLDSNSTNCLLNSLNVVEHEKRYGFHPYSYEVARLVREGYLTRAEGLKRLTAPVNAATVREARRRLRA